MTKTVGAVLVSVRDALRKGGIEDPAAEARILVGGLLGLDRTGLLTRDGDFLSEEDEERIKAAVDRRLQGEPPHRILGMRSFFGLDLTLNPHTLEPRPDTEILVETVLDILAERRKEPLSVLDLGTGTGAICLALLSTLPAARGTGVDLAAGALDAARRNAVTNGLGDRFETVESNWFDHVSGRFDVIVSNPPYIATAIIASLDREVREHDPLLALDGGPDGLDAYRILATDAAEHLAPGGLLAVEIGYDQNAAVKALFEKNGWIFRVERKDFGGNDRVLVFERPMDKQ
ncbi:peptide chain release factor N(5)-glutamine methyltransferase [Rhizobium alvei]|uniref:Release factor glutamine methyltransferase n=1 Tax=Rhizobium alvei TaxID=1132659 RepID=A0ABT8YM32_9HYPH|nr:peptide chain release factor N(5)-glutamine methyltransferase [Rhizobium alvei]MDO6964801.1 peptide chain release factor N(5)-glutamine methyltransferase [Rhizobium alvei]